MFIMSLLTLSPTTMQADDNSTSTSNTTTRWQGADVTKLTSSDQFFLYNVGTGRFAMQGGLWGVQGMLLYQDYGAAMNIDQSYTDKTITNPTNSKQTYAGNTTAHTVIYSGASSTSDVSGKAISGICFGINYPSYTGGTTNSDFTKSAGYVIFDAQPSGFVGGDGYTRQWTFQRVETDASATTYTYYMKETIHNTNTSKSDKNLWLGAVYGHAISTNDQDVFVGNNTITFQDAANNNFQPTADSLNYQWRLVTKAEVEKILTTTNADEYGGLNANLSYLLSDPNFDHNRDTEFGKWTVTSTAPSTDGNYIFDWPNVANNGTSYITPTTSYKVKPANMLPDLSSSSTTLTPWDRAIFRKLQAPDADGGQYSFGSLEGIGTATQSFTAPATGNYLIQCLGVYKGHEAYLTATADGTTKTASFVEMPSTITASKCTQAASGAVTTNTAAWKTISKAIAEDENTYTVSILISATKGQTITIGVKKDEATQSNKVKTDASGNNYYFDTDFALIDNVSVRFFSGSAMVLDEDATSTDYMQKKETNSNVLLKRTFTLNNWNTLVLPLDVTMAQLKSAFGDDVQLAKLHGVGTISGSKTSIDYQKMTLTADGNAIEAGAYYLIKPSKSPTHLEFSINDGTTTTNYSGDYYIIGRRTFDWSAGVPATVSDFFGSSQNYTKGKVQSTGTYVKITNGCPAGAYVISKGEMYHLTSAMDIKGFRTWLTDVDNPSKGMTLNLTDDGTVTRIGSVVIPGLTEGNSTVYTIDGKVVSVDNPTLNGLPHGLYIVNGKKMMK